MFIDYLQFHKPIFLPITSMFNFPTQSKTELLSPEQQYMYMSCKHKLTEP